MDIENHNYAQQKLIMKQTISTCTRKQLSTENTVHEVVLSDLNFARVHDKICYTPIYTVSTDFIKPCACGPQFDKFLTMVYNIHIHCISRRRKISKHLYTN